MVHCACVILPAIRNEHDHVLLFLVHDCILTNIFTEIYNSLLFHFVLFSVQHDLAHRIALNTVSAQGVKSFGHDNDAGIVMPFRVCIQLKKRSKHLLLIIVTEKIINNISWSCLVRQARPLSSPLRSNKQKEA